MAAGEFRYRIKADDKTRKATRSASRNADKLNKSVGSLKGSMLKLGGAVAAAMSMQKLVGVAKDSVKAYGKQIQAEQKLAAALESTGENADRLLPKFKDIASEIQNVTTHGDEATLEIMQLARAQGIATENMEEATRGAIGLSKAYGINARRAVQGVANAFEGQFTTLQRYIPELRSAETEAEKMAIVQEKMANGFEVAKSEANNAYGSLEQMNNAVGDLQEQLGQTIAEGIQPFVDALKDSASQMAENISKARTYNELIQQSRKDGGLTTRQELELEKMKLENLRSQLEAQKKLGKNREGRGGMIGEFSKDTEELENKIAAAGQRVATLTRELGNSKDETKETADNTEKTKDNIEEASKYASDFSDWLGEWNKKAAPMQAKLENLRENLGRAKVNLAAAMKESSNYSDAEIKKLRAIEAHIKEQIRLIKEKNKEMSREQMRGMRGLTAEGNVPGGNIARPTSSISRTQTRGMRGLNAEGNTALGSMKSKALSDLADQLGNKMSEAMGPVAESMQTAVKAQGSQMQGSGGGIASMLGGLFKSMSGPIGMVVQAVSQLGNVVKLLNPFMTIVQGIMDVLGPLINNLLAPLIGILKIVGQTIGKMLAPALKLLKPIITVISKIFIWLYNKIIVPVYNGIMTVFNSIIRAIQGFINGIIRLVNKIPFVNINTINKRSKTAGHLDKISMDNLRQEGSTDDSTSTTGDSASYTSGTKITVENFSINTDVITGEDGGFRQLVRMIMAEMNQIERLA